MLRAEKREARRVARQYGATSSAYWSTAWFAYLRAWAQTQRCAKCTRRANVFHHRSYKFIGTWWEKWRGQPLCHDCHQRVHDRSYNYISLARGGHVFTGRKADTRFKHRY